MKYILSGFIYTIAILVVLTLVLWPFTLLFM